MHNQFSWRFALTLIFAITTLLAVAPASLATTFTVNYGADLDDVNFGGTHDGICDADNVTAGDQCTLRAAIQEINAESTAPPDIIHFSASTLTLDALTLLPIITQQMTIDGCNGTPGAAPCVTINNTNTGAALRASQPVEIRGIAFTGSDSAATGISLSNANNSVIEGNWFGMATDGTPSSVGAPTFAVRVTDSDAVRIGGTTAAQRNVFVNSQRAIELADGVTSMTISGNYFSTNSAGQYAAQNGNMISPVGTAIFLDNAQVTNLTIGGQLNGAQLATPECDGPCNLIGAGTNAIDLGVAQIGSYGFAIHGNYIGTTLDGSAATNSAATGTNGIVVGNHLDVNIGDGTASRRNVIGGSWTNGIVKTGTAGLLEVRGNHLGVNAAGTARIPMETTAATIAGSASAPSSLVGNRFSHSTSGGEALLITGDSAVVTGNTFGVGTGGEALQMAAAIRVTGSSASIGGDGADANVICSVTSAAAIQLDGGASNGLGANHLGQLADGTTCTGTMQIHSGVRAFNGATDTKLVEYEAEPLNIANPVNDAIVFSGASTGNLVGHITARDVGGQVVDLGNTATGDGVGNASMANGNALAPTVILAGATSTLQVQGLGAVAGSTIRVYETTAAAGSQPTQVTRLISQATDADGGDWRVQISLSNADVGKRVAVTQTLANGSTSELSNAATLADGSAPNTSIASGPTGSTNDNTPTFTFAADEATSGYWCRLGDTGSYTDCTSPHTISPALPDGTYTLYVRAVDLAVLVDPTPATITFTVDTTPPDTVLVDPPSGRIRTTTPTMSFAAAGSETATSFECSIDSGAFTACTSPFKPTALAQRAHTIAVRALDAVGNPDAIPAQASFVVDTVTPVLSTASKSLVPDSRGRVRVKLRCNDVGRPCTGTLTLRSRSKLRLPSGAKRYVTFATMKYSVTGSAEVTVVAKISRSNLALLAGRGSVPVELRSAPRDAAGNTGTFLKRLPLRPAS